MTQDETENNSQPVAFMARVKLGSLAGQLIQVEHATNLNPKLYDGPFPVFRHADPVEVERKLEDQRREFSHVQAVEHRKWVELVENLKARLAGRDALLRDTKRCIERNDYPVFELLKRIDATLSASAE